MSPSKFGIDKRIFNWEDQQQQSINTHNIGSALLFTKNIIIYSVGSFLLFGIIAGLAVVYWCTRQQQRLLKAKSQPSESTPFSSANVKTARPKEITLIPFVPNLIQSKISDINDDTSSSSSATDASQNNRKKNLLQRRGPNHSLTISVTPKPRLLNSPSSDRSPDEYLQTATRKLTIEELHQHAQDIPAVTQEFWSTPANHADRLRIYGAGTKNRYLSIIANENSRVKLDELPGDPVSSYINANYISGWPNERHAFIATQGPLSNTIVDFYRMIWQEHVPVIVMITRLVEKNKSKCERYIPELQANQYGSFYVEVKSIINQNDYQIRRLNIEFENEQREVEHYWYTAWPDHLCPDIAQPLIELVHKVESSRMELSQINRRSGPVVVHCSAGIGRTGCFIALSNGIKQLNKEHIVDVVRIFCDLRRDRGGMIQTNDQYQFLYQALSEYARTL